MEVDEIMPIFAPRTMDASSLIGIGVSPIGRVVRFVATLFLWLVRINLEAHQLAILLKDVVFQNVVGQVDALRIQYMASQRIGYHLAQGCRKV